MLAMDVNDNAGHPVSRGVLATIASMLAPAGAASATVAVALRSDRRTQSQDNAPTFFRRLCLAGCRYVCLFGRLSLTTLECLV